MGEIARPRNLVPIISWPSWSPDGSRQCGYHDSRGFCLQNMVPMTLTAKISQQADKFLRGWLTGVETPRKGFFHGIIDDGIGQVSSSEAELRERLRQVIAVMGFTGCAVPLICESGFAFTQLDASGKSGLEVFAAASLRLVTRAVLRTRNSTGKTASPVSRKIQFVSTGKCLLTASAFVLLEQLQHRALLVPQIRLALQSAPLVLKLVSFACAESGTSL